MTNDFDLLELNKDTVDAEIDSMVGESNPTLVSKGDRKKAQIAGFDSIYGNTPQGLPNNIKHKNLEVLHDYNSNNLMVYYQNNEIIGRPIHIKAVGMTYRPNGMQILEDLKNHFKPENIMVMLEREATNKYDKNAIKVHVGVKTSDKRYHIGYVPKTSSEFYSFIMDSGKFKITTSNVAVVGGGFDSNFGLHFIATIGYK